MLKVKGNVNEQYSIFHYVNDTETLPADKVFFYTGFETCSQSGRIIQLGKLPSRLIITVRRDGIVKGVYAYDQTRA